MIKKYKKKKRRRPNLLEVIQEASSERLASIAKKLKPGHHARAKIQDELVARDLGRGGPNKSWGHG